MPITILMSGPPLWQLQFFFSLEHVIYYVVLSCIFFLHGTCNILLVHSQREYKVAIYVRSSLTFVCFFFFFFYFIFFFLVDTSQREYTVTKKIGLNRLLFMSIIVALLATVQTDRFNHYMRHTKIPYRSDLEG